MNYQTAVQQHEGEFARFIEILKRENVRSYLEIGSKFGGSLWKVANALPKDSRIVSVDLPWGNRESEPDLRACVEELMRIGYDAHLILGDSTSSEVIAKVLDLGPYMATFVDANHTRKYVLSDWENFSPISDIIAFHDIAWKERPERSGKMPIEVPTVWQEIKGGRRFEEIQFSPRDNGIGVIWLK